jgi:molybdopterin synthase catalytic subunit
LKELVPIWKKENWADGRTEWVHPNAERAMRNETSPL